MTNEIQVLQEAKKELFSAVWAGELKYADEGSFDDLETRDKFVLEKVAATIKHLETYIRKTRPVQNNKRVTRKKKSLFN
jgi:hypothetical protein